MKHLAHDCATVRLEDVGYLVMGVAFLFAATVFGQRERLERVIRLLFIICSVLAVGSFVLLALLYGSDLEYRYEVVAILIDWTVLIVSGALLSVFFRRAGRDGTSRLPEGSSS
jgi:cytochrome bd-type quinol oxidase subunit 2